MPAHIILLNLLTYNLTIDGVEIRAHGGFRGFHSVPLGEHEVSMRDNSGEEITTYFDLRELEVEVRVYDFHLKRFETADDAVLRKYTELAISSAMGIALWPYPPLMKNLTDPELIRSIFNQANRLKFLLGDRYEIPLDTVSSIGIGMRDVSLCEGTRSIGLGLVSLKTEEKTLFFQPLLEREVLMPPIYGVSPVQVEFDPSLWQNLVELIIDYRGGLLREEVNP